MMHTGMVAGAGVAMVAAGRTVAKPVQATLGAPRSRKMHRPSWRP
jgi:hypothetical protein